jgi:type 1 glutamine amidotransferase
MHVCVICDDIYHPGDIVRRGVEELNRTGSANGLREDIDWEFVTDTSDWPMSRFDDVDVILLAKGNSRTAADVCPWLTDQVQQGFVDFVERGGGLLAIHAGIVGYRDLPLVRTLVGGAFVRHPEQCAVTVEFTGDSEIGPPAEPFTVHDEHYFVQTYAGDLDVFLASRSTSGVQPAGWTRRQGSGRVCVLTPGHNLDVFLHPTYQQTILRALHWCSGEERPF